MQVTGKLAALFVQAQHKPDAPAHMQPVVGDVLIRWLAQAVDAIHASPASRAAAAVRQQLLDSRLLQHLGPAMDAAAAGLTAAVTALEAAVTISTSTSTALSRSTQQDSMQRLLRNLAQADTQCDRVLKIFWFVSNVLSPADDVNVHAMLPAAPAAVRFVFKGFQCRSRVQQIRQRLQQGQLGDGALFISSCPRMAYNAMRILALDGASLALRSLPGTGGLLLSPELLSCLALVLVVSALGLDTGSADGIGRNLSTSSSSGVRSSMHPQHPSTREQQQQDSGSSSGGRADGLRDVVQLDRLTPLSCSLFDMLGVSKETALQAAGLARSRGLTTLEALTVVMSRYSNVLEHQVSYEPDISSPLPC